jgi:osmotically-inducible protein OsmY
MRIRHHHTLALLACGVAMLGLGACASAPDSYRYAGAYAAEERRSSEGDELITSLIREQFARDPRVDAGDIDVDTYRGTVALSGQVDDSAEIRRAVKIALATPGVRTVRNDMRLARP